MRPLLSCSVHPSFPLRFSFFLLSRGRFPLTRTRILVFPDCRWFARCPIVLARFRANRLRRLAVINRSLMRSIDPFIETSFNLMLENKYRETQRIKESTTITHGTFGYFRRGVFISLKMSSNENCTKNYNVILE